MWEQNKDVNTLKKPIINHGSEGYFDWRESMEKHQWKSERQVLALLHEAKRLKEENEVLCM